MHCDIIIIISKLWIVTFFLGFLLKRAKNNIRRETKGETNSLPLLSWKISVICSLFFCGRGRCNVCLSHCRRKYGFYMFPRF